MLSHPLIVEAAEDEFIPVVVYNNRSTGPDVQLLKQFNEPAWNYQVIRFLDADGKDIIERKDKIWSLGGVATRMGTALKTTSQDVPNYLQTLASSSNSKDHSLAAFSMYCFWTGEFELGNIEGVVATEAGWLDGHEVTLVEYDQKVLPLDELATQASKVKCANKIYTKQGKSLAGLPGGNLDDTYRAAKNSDQKKQITKWTKIGKVPGLNKMQLTKINAQAPRDAKMALQWLSPRQRRWFVEAQGIEE